MPVDVLRVVNASASWRHSFATGISVATSILRLRSSVPMIWSFVNSIRRVCIPFDSVASVTYGAHVVVLTECVTSCTPSTEMRISGQTPPAELPLAYTTTCFVPEVSASIVVVSA